VLVGKPNGIELVELEFSENEVVNVKRSVVADVEQDLPHTRFNDGKCDNNGILWAGTMHVDCVTDKQGSLYSFTFDEKTRKLIPKKHLDNVGISNGIVWNKTGDTMYYIDSFAEGIFAFDYVHNGLDVEIKNQRIIFKIPKEWDSLPDGMAIDTDDKLWVAMYGNSSVVRIDPLEKDPNKQALFRVDVPGACKITACAFAGNNWTDLYITSASQRLDQQTLEKYPQSGYLFFVNLQEYFEQVGVRGAPFVPFYAL
jgi:sugar lactone lactonase YvrE